MRITLGLCLLLGAFRPLGAAPPPPVIVLAGGGPEGDLGDASAWSAGLYRALLEGGDRNGDGRVVVAVLTRAERPTDFIPRYFRWLGADEAYNVSVPERTQAESPFAAEALLRADAVFIKGGDQGAYYDAWRDTRLHRALRTLAAGGANFGGTSAGAMILAQFAFAGGKSLTSQQAWEDGRTPWLDDASSGGTALHEDFLPLVRGAVIDTHFTARERLGRLLGILARAWEERPGIRILGLGLDERTGIVLRGAHGRVEGLGTATLVQALPGAASRRESGRPLQLTGVRLDRVGPGGRIDLGAALALPAPPAPPPQP